MEDAEHEIIEEDHEHLIVKFKGVVFIYDVVIDI